MSYHFETDLFLSRPYLTKEQISRARQNTIIDLRTYHQKKLAALKFLSDICVQLGFLRKTLEAAVYFYGRYYLFNSFETELCFTVATSCLILGCKQVETFKKVNEICTLSLKLRNVIKINQELLENYKKRVFQLELRVLEACCFDYRVNNHVHIDGYIIKIGKKLSLNKDVCRLAWYMVYDVLKLDLLLIVPQHAISLALLKVSSELFGIKEWRANYAEFETSEREVKEAYFEILNFYISSYDTSDLKSNIHSSFPQVDVAKFMAIKKENAPEMGLPEIPSASIEQDTFLASQKNPLIRERRYVLTQELVTEEAEALGKTK